MPFFEYKYQLNRSAVGNEETLGDRRPGRPGNYRLSAKNADSGETGRNGCALFAY